MTKQKKNIMRSKKELQRSLSNAYKYLNVLNEEDTEPQIRALALSVDWLADAVNGLIENNTINNRTIEKN